MEEIKIKYVRTLEEATSLYNNKIKYFNKQKSDKTKKALIEQLNDKIERCYKITDDYLYDENIDIKYKFIDLIHVDVKDECIFLLFNQGRIFMLPFRCFEENIEIENIIKKFTVSIEKNKVKEELNPRNYEDEDIVLEVAMKNIALSETNYLRDVQRLKTNVFLILKILAIFIPAVAISIYSSITSFEYLPNNTIILIILYIVYLFLFIKLITNFRKYKIDKVLKKIDEKMFKYTTVITNYDITIEYENVTERYKLDDILQVVWGKIPYFIIRENKKFKRIFLVGLSVDTPIKKAVKNRLLDAVKKNTNGKFIKIDKPKNGKKIIKRCIIPLCLVALFSGPLTISFIGNFMPKTYNHMGEIRVENYLLQQM